MFKLTSSLQTGAASPDPNAKTPGGQNSKDQEYEALNIIIDYDIRNPKDGIQVVKPTDLYPHVRIAWQETEAQADGHVITANTALLYICSCGRCSEVLGTLRRLTLGEMHLGAHSERTSHSELRARD